MNEPLKATHEGELKLGEKTLNCAVLDDGTRVLSASAVFEAFDRPRKGKSNEDYRVDQMPSFINANNLQPFVNSDLRGWTELIEYQSKSGTIKTGYNARILRGLCKVYIDAKHSGELLKSQERFVVIAETLLYALSDIGITALVDEATGYQYDREKDALQVILKAYISDELLKWQQKFPDSFYFEIFRLNGWDYTVSSIKKRPGVVGTWTNELIYKQLPKGVLEELKERTPKSEAGNYTARFFQSLTPDIGHPSLTAQIYKVIGIMSISNTWAEFKYNFNKMVDRNNGQTEIDFDNIEMN